MRFFLRLPICCALLSVTMTALANPIVVTDQNHPVYNVPANTRVIELDATNRLYAQLSDNLPTDPRQAEQIAKERLELMGNQFQLAMQAVFQGAMEAWMMGIAKIPAVVLDGHVVYGETDVSHAVLKIQTYQEQVR